MQTASLPGAQLSDLRVEYLRESDHVAIGEPIPRFSWTLQSDDSVRNVTQTGYEVSVAALTGDSGREVVWNSTRVDGDATLQIESGVQLQPAQRYEWSVRSWLSTGDVLESAPARFTTSLFDEADWDDR